MKHVVLESVIEKTKKFLELMPKNKRKKKGQFFTSMETARYMAGMFNVASLPQHVQVLDPGAGSGILSAAMVERLNECEGLQSIHLTCYETDPEVRPLLLENMKIMQAQSVVPLHFEIREESYILAQQHDFANDLLANPHAVKYDLIIAIIRSGNQSGFSRSLNHQYPLICQAA